MKMYRILFAAITAVVLFSSGTTAQILEPVKWSFSSKKISDTEAELILTAIMDKGWHLYSQYIPPNGPVPTSFSFQKSSHYKTTGKVVEPKPIEQADPNFDNMILKFFDKKAVFRQKISLLTEKPFVVKGVLEFMCCNDVSCLPPIAF